jgi:negative regulator of sigma E activity
MRTKEDIEAAVEQAGDVGETESVDRKVASAAWAMVDAAKQWARMAVAVMAVAAQVVVAMVQAVREADMMAGLGSEEEARTAVAMALAAAASPGGSAQPRP